MAAGRVPPKLEALLREHGFELIRHKKHRVFSNGQVNFVMASTPSDARAEKNHIRNLKRALRSREIR